MSDLAYSRTRLLASCAATACAVVLGVATSLAPQDARAGDCLLDTNDNGTASDGVDTDLTANSLGDPDSLACGRFATAGVNGAVAIGTNVKADDESVGQQDPVLNGVTTHAAPVAIGPYSSAVGTFALAVGGGAIAGYQYNSANSTVRTIQPAYYSTAIGGLANARVYGATAVGYGSSATGESSIAIGRATAAAASSAIAIGLSATANRTDATAIGHNARATGDWAIALGTDSRATGETSVAVGRLAEAGTHAIAIGGATDLQMKTQALGTSSVAIGYEAATTAANSTALGVGASARSVSAVALGDHASASGPGGNAIGLYSSATGHSTVALGTSSAASGTYSAALGRQASSGGNSSAALGYLASSAGQNSVALGREASAAAVGTVALGYATSAAGNAATAVGYQANAAGYNSTALGRQASAGFSSSTAVGFGATTTRADQVELGGTGSSVTIGDIDASTAAQSGNIYVMTVDQSGTVGRQASVLTTAGVEQITKQLVSTLAVSDAQFSALESRVDALDYRLDDMNRNSRRGIAAAMAQADAPMPSAPGKTSYTGKGATYRGELAFSLGLTHRLDTETPFALMASVSHSGGKSTGATVGFTGEF